jgi:voltage-gated potassium channel
MTGSVSSGAGVRVLRALFVLGVVLACLLFVGTFAFMVVGDEGFEEAFYRSFGSFTTTQFFAEPPTSRERAIAAILTLAGGLFYIAVLLSVVRQLGPSLMAREYDRFRQRLRERRMDDLNDHFIVCGYGNVGRAVTEALRRRNRFVVVIDRKPENVEAANRSGATAFVGEASDSGVLATARIRDASAVIATVGTDAENFYILLAASELNPKAELATRASDPKHAALFQSLFEKRRVHVITPYETAGEELARCVLEHPDAVRSTETDAGVPPSEASV